MASDQPVAALVEPRPRRWLDLARLRRETAECATAIRVLRELAREHPVPPRQRPVFDGEAYAWPDDPGGSRERGVRLGRTVLRDLRRLRGRAHDLCSLRALHRGKLHANAPCLDEEGRVRPGLLRVMLLMEMGRLKRAGLVKEFAV